MERPHVGFIENFGRGPITAMTEYTVYVDEVIANNLVMNCAILYLTARLAGISYRFWRLVGAALTGSLYLLVLFLPVGAYLYNFAAKLLLSVVMLVIAFGWLSWRRFLLVWALFLGISFMVGGVVMGISSLVASTGNEIAGYRFLWPGILVALLLVGVAGRKGNLLRRRIAAAFFRVPVILHVGTAKIELEGLIDTGNQLRDPVTRDPVVVVELEALKDFLPGEVREALAKEHDPDFPVLATGVKDTAWLRRLRLIPYRSLGKSGGVLVGFRPDMVEVLYGGKVVKTSRVVVAIYRHRLSPEASYNALLHPALLKAVL